MMGTIEPWKSDGVLWNIQGYLSLWSLDTLDMSHSIYVSI
jgi:hypothetical protein